MVSKVEPPPTSTILSPLLISIEINPLGVSLAFAKSNIAVSNNVTNRKITIVTVINKLKLIVYLV